MAGIVGIVADGGGREYDVGAVRDEMAGTRKRERKGWTSVACSVVLDKEQCRQLSAMTALAHVTSRRLYSETV